MLKMMSALLALGAGPAFAEDVAWRSTSEEPFAFQRVSEDEVFFCREGGEAGVTCAVLPAAAANEAFTFELGPISYAVGADHVVSETVTNKSSERTVALERIAPAVPEGPYGGEWTAGGRATFEVTTFDPATGQGTLAMRFGDDPAQTLAFHMAGALMEVAIMGPDRLVIMVAGDRAYGLYRPTEGPAHSALFWPAGED